MRDLSLPWCMIGKNFQQTRMGYLSVIWVILGWVYILLFFFFFEKSHTAGFDPATRYRVRMKVAGGDISTVSGVEKVQNIMLCVLLSIPLVPSTAVGWSFFFFFVLYELVEGGQDNFTCGRMAFSFVPTRMSMCLSCFVVKRILSVCCAFLFVPSARSDGHFWW